MDMRVRWIERERHDYSTDENEDGPSYEYTEYAQDFLDEEGLVTWVGNVELVGECDREDAVEMGMHPAAREMVHPIKGNVVVACCFENV